MRSDRFSRQSFLGEDSESIFAKSVVGVVGLGGGGSHIAQQLAHLGVGKLVLFDADKVEASNLNRLVGATEADARLGTDKITVAGKLILGISSALEVVACRSRWQEAPEELKMCDLVFGCLDGFQQRRELEEIARRFLLPYIDIGLDVHRVGAEPPRMGGHVILSMPGAPCMWCIGFLNESRLSEEAARYGDAGIRPQVVWANGVLASLAVGVAVDLLTDWTKNLQAPIYLEYDGNAGLVRVHPRVTMQPHLVAASFRCEHFSDEAIGPVRFARL
jgi:hypothetical protein